MNPYTTADYISEFDYDYFETHTIKRVVDSETLNNLFRKRMNEEKFTKAELNIFKQLEESHVSVDSSERILSEDGTFHNASRLVSKVQRNSSQGNQLIEILRTEFEQEITYRCSPVFRDLILFYNSNNELINGLNICLSCDSIETLRGSHINTEAKVFTKLKHFLEELGHII